YAHQWELSKHEPECGTTACIAGHICLASDVKWEDMEVGVRGYAETACWVMGWHEGWSELLFYDAMSWPNEYARRARHDDSQEEKAKAAADLLDAIADGRWDV